MPPGMKGTTILRTQNGVVRVVEDTWTGTYSIGLRTDAGVEWKYISQELHDLLIKELKEQEGKE